MSDLHGNAHAVRAVLTDAAVIRVDEWWILGDLVALGTDPIEVLELLAALPNVRCIGGNTERYVLTGDRPYPDFTDVRQDPDWLERLVPSRRRSDGHEVRSRKPAGGTGSPGCLPIFA